MYNTYNNTHTKMNISINVLYLIQIFPILVIIFHRLVYLFIYIVHYFYIDYKLQEMRHICLNIFIMFQI